MYEVDKPHSYASWSMVRLFDNDFFFKFTLASWYMRALEILRPLFEYRNLDKKTSIDLHVLRH